jgi:hypothetical protein
MQRIHGITPLHNTEPKSTCVLNSGFLASGTSAAMLQGILLQPAFWQGGLCQVTFPYPRSVRKVSHTSAVHCSSCCTCHKNAATLLQGCEPCHEALNKRFKNWRMPLVYKVLKGINEWWRCMKVRAVRANNQPPNHYQLTVLHKTVHIAQPCRDQAAAAEPTQSQT